MAKSKDSTMKCLSIQQPWAWAVCAGIKTIENRNWTTNHRGTIAIHAGSKRQQVEEFIRNSDPQLSRRPFAFSAIIGAVDLVDVVEMNAELESNPFAVGEYCWRFANAKLFAEPIPCHGKLRLFNLAEDLTCVCQSRLQSKTITPAGDSIDAWTKTVSEVDSGIHKARGRCYINLEHLDDALRNFDLAVECDPEDSTAYYCRALLWTTTKDNPFRGIADCTKALELDGQHADAYLLRATAYRMLGNVESAVADERRADEIEPGSLERWQTENESDD